MGRFQEETDTDILCESEFPVDKIFIMQDKNDGDFLPGKGIYSKKSYIADGLHDEEIMATINRLKPPLCRQKAQKYYYNAITKKFRKAETLSKT